MLVKQQILRNEYYFILVKFQIAKDELVAYCAQCANEFYITPFTRRDRQDFCSPQCKWEHYD